jgi:hypothetical protein
MAQKIRYEFGATFAATSAIMLATGWLLTWARLSSEHLSSQDILAALPRSYFIQISIQSMLSPLVISVLVGGIWVILSVRRFKPTDPRAIWEWSVFGLILALISWGVALLVNSARSRHGIIYFAWEGGACAAAVAFAGTFGWLLRTYLGSFSPTGAWNLVRPIAAFTVVLCFLIACMLRVTDARFASDVLPDAQVVIDTPCTALTGGIVPTVPGPVHDTTGNGSTTTDRCQIAGFYLGENSNWIYMIQRACNSRYVPLLLDVRRESVQEMIVFQRVFACSPPKTGISRVPSG